MLYGLVAEGARNPAVLGARIMDSFHHAIASDAIADAFTARDAHRLANVLIHAVAVHAGTPAAGAYVLVLLALGYDAPARALAERLGAVHVEEDGGELVVRSPYDDAFVQACRAIRGRRWANKANRFPVAERAAVWSAIVRCYRGAVVFGSKGARLALPPKPARQPSTEAA